MRGGLAAPDRASRRQAIEAWACLAAIITICAFSAALAAGSLRAPHSDSGFSLLVIPVAITSAALGVLIRLRRPDNLVGWLLLANAFTLATLSLAWPYAYFAGVSHPGRLPGASWAAMWSEMGWPGIYVFLMAIAFVFPDGHLPSRRWRKVIAATVVSYIGLELSFAFNPGHFDAPFEHLAKPTPSYPGSLQLLWVPFYVGVLGSLFAAFFAVRSRLRGANGPERLQILWFTYAAMLIPLALVICIVTGLASATAASIAQGIAIFAMLIAVPAAVAIGILRYRLFDIELAINRTLVYGTLTLCIAVGYVAIVTGLDALISQRGIAGVLAAGLVAAGVQPLRLRLQRRSDRWIYGDRSDPYAALTRLGDRLQGTLAPGEVVQTVVDSVAEALRLRYAAIEFDRDGGIEVAAAHGDAGDRQRSARPPDLSRRGDRQPGRRGPAGTPPDRPRRAAARRPRAARRAGGPRRAPERRPATLARAARRGARGGAPPSAPRSARWARSGPGRHGAQARRRAKPRRRTRTSTRSSPSCAARPRSRSPTCGASSTSCGRRRWTSSAWSERCASRLARLSFGDGGARTLSVATRRPGGAAHPAARRSRSPPTASSPRP